MTRRTGWPGRLWILWAVVCATCSDGPTAPAPVPGSAAPASLVVSGLPQDFAVADTAQLRARAVWTDGRTEEVTSRVRWGSKTLACIITASGLATALEAGECAITATLDNVSSAVTMVVSPARTFTVTGVVREKYQSREPPIKGARVTLTSGAQKGRIVVADSLGRYAFDGVPRAPVTIQVTAEDFEPETTEVLPEQPEVDVFLTPATSVLVYDSRVRGSRNEFVVMPFRVNHRGPATLVQTLESNECGTYETFSASVRQSGVTPTALLGGGCVGTTTTTAMLGPGDFEFVVWRLGTAPRLTYAELRHPR